MNDNVKALTKVTAYLNLMYLEAKQEGVNYANTELHSLRLIHLAMFNYSKSPMS